MEIKTEIDKPLIVIKKNVLVFSGTATKNLEDAVRIHRKDRLAIFSADIKK
jgi:hypothetical protein